MSKSPKMLDITKWIRSIAMAIQMPQVPQDLWQTVLNVFAWAWRIPVACFVVFTCGCIGFLGFVFVYRVTSFIYRTYLAAPF
jgi:hypothetical protein